MKVVNKSRCAVSSCKKQQVPNRLNLSFALSSDKPADKLAESVEKVNLGADTLRAALKLPNN